MLFRPAGLLLANRVMAVTTEHRDLLTHPDLPEKCLKIISHEHLQLLNVPKKAVMTTLLLHISGSRITKRLTRKILCSTWQTLERIPDLPKSNGVIHPAVSAAAFRALCSVWCCYRVLKIKSREIKFPMKGNECSSSKRD